MRKFSESILRITKLLRMLILRVSQVGPPKKITKQKKNKKKLKANPQEDSSIIIRTVELKKTEAIDWKRSLEREKLSPRCGRVSSTCENHRWHPP